MPYTAKAQKHQQSSHFLSERKRVCDEMERKLPVNKFNIQEMHKIKNNVLLTGM